MQLNLKYLKCKKLKKRLNFILLFSIIYENEDVTFIISNSIKTNNGNGIKISDLIKRKLSNQSRCLIPASKAMIAEYFIEQ